MLILGKVFVNVNLGKGIYFQASLSKDCFMLKMIPSNISPTILFSQRPLTSSLLSKNMSTTWTLGKYTMKVFLKFQIKIQMNFEPYANLELSYHGFHSVGTKLTMTKYLMVAYE